MKQKPNAALDREALAFFYSSNVIVGEPLLVKSGKEATVYRCEGHPETGLPFVAAKFYRPREVRRFKNDAIYREGRDTNERAAKKKSGFFRELEFATWIGMEYETLRYLHRKGLDVPKPLTYSDHVLLMEYIGDADAPGIPLHQVILEPVEAREIFDRLWQNVERMLECHRVHGDLSPFNILYHAGKVAIIDFPQAVDPRANNSAFDLLWRDIDNLCRYFADYGILADAERLAKGLWARYTRARLYSFR